MKNTGGPAFPNEQYATTDMTGMTLRDYFAAKAMQGLLASPRSPGAGRSMDGITPDLIADLSGKLADAMMVERSK